MALNRAMIRNRNWWMGLIGAALQLLGYLLHLRAKTAGYALWFLGLGLFFFWVKAVYDNSELKTKEYELIPRSEKPRIL